MAKEPVISPAIGAFYAATQELGVANQVTTFTMSDFNRAFQPNGNNGKRSRLGKQSLRAWGAAKGGRVSGTMPTLALGGPLQTTRVALLNNAGYEVAAVDSDNAALALLETEHFDLILIGGILPSNKKALTRGFGRGIHIFWSLRSRTEWIRITFIHRK
ncbi:hypothetical protein ACPOL_7163 (plasmid) [Acidisarcina polymorpha]|uniref:Oligopeptide ABC transporter, periplasmic oligopeptide-binding protein OppA n=1 Tax=Acidisarcina polymorpha TaxID=2211140 RepID=A0A2Z5GCK9_9BACT|nr:DUF1501 domain-containing protein [Acidisarcina polymorpha]AXC16317.1 Oligopeptide ABC transporter, periplasmic oligopeptide-binding protein OppA [Acidisarcina polymorpha]AXC16355.1 hypothetical protein ACPOL_7163 [Acidisarcina polymorpha]